MARPCRCQIAGLTQHIIKRGNNRCDIFRTEKDYVFFLATMRDAALRYQLDVHIYILMSNHVHVVATPRTTLAVSKTMQIVGSRYARYFNRRYTRTGTLFEGRFKSMIIDSEKYWFTCARYVELNPVRAGLVAQPGDYRWSSYHTNAQGDEDSIVVPHPLYLSLGRTAAARQKGWMELCREAIPEGELLEIRDAVRRGVPIGKG